MLLNHKDNLDSMFTLVHEMGHAMHTWHSCKYQPVNTAEYVIFVAEVASTCNEILLMRHLLGKTDDRKQRAYLINTSSTSSRVHCTARRCSPSSSSKWARWPRAARR